MALVDGTVSHCCSHQQPQARVMCISHEHMRLLVLLTRSDAELPLQRVSMSKALKMLSCVKVAAARLQCSAERITKRTFNHSCGNRCYTNFLENNFGIRRRIHKNYNVLTLKYDAQTRTLP